MKASEIAGSITSIIEERFIDRQYGGAHGAIDYDTTTVLTYEKQVETQAMLAWATLAGGQKELAVHFLDYLVDSVDRQHGGVIEVRERYGLVNELGNVKTTYRMFLAAFVLLKARNLEGGEEYVKEGIGILSYLASHAIAGDSNDYYSKVSRDWRTVLDEKRSPKNMAFAVLAANQMALASGEAGDRQDAIDKAGCLMDNYVEQTGRVVEWRRHDGTVMTGGVKVDLITSSQVAIALLDIYDLSQNQAYLDAARKIVSYINGYLWDTRFGGFWTHCDLDGKITIHREFITLLTSTIPIKTTAGNSWALIANCLLWKKTKAEAQMEFIKDGFRYLHGMLDRVNGGLFIGEGYFWTPPGTPVGPFLRLMLPTRETPGVFHFGSSSFLRLYNKHADSQAVGLLASTVMDEVLKDYKGDNRDVKAKVQNKTSHSPQGTEFIYENLSLQTVVNLTKDMDVQKHVDWIQGAHTPNIGYGWTPFISPLGTKPDRTPSIFGIHHSIANLKVFGVPIKDRERIADWIRNCQSSNGAYGEYPGGPADVLNTYLAVNVLDMLGESNYGDHEACINYLQKCQNSDGGFGVVPGFKSDLFHTNLAAVALLTLQAEPRGKDNLISYLLSAENPDGGYGEYPSGPSDTYSCYRAIGTLALYDKAIPHPELTAVFLRKCQGSKGSGGGFGHDWDGRQSMVATYHAVAALHLLNSTPEHLEECVEWVSGCQTPDGGFSNIPGVTTGTIDEGFAAVQSLCILRMGLSRAFIILVS